METMYWITRLDALNVTLGILMIISIVCIIGCILTYLISVALEFNEISEGANKAKKKLIVFVAIFIISTISYVFIPTTNEAIVMIYGVNGTLEWIKDNDNAKQLPDKAVEALSLYLDNINNELKENNENTKTK